MEKAQRLRYIEQTMFRDIDILFLDFPVAAFVCAYPFYQSHITEILQMLFNGGIGDFQLFGEHFTGYRRLD